MWRRLVTQASIALIAVSAFTAFVGCGDIFHDTSSIAAACDGGACAADASNDGTVPVSATNFCEWDGDTTEARAQHACAWLGACESPVGSNRYAECVIAAKLAFDCRVNPNRKPQGALHAYWDCLWRVTSCDDVARCVFVNGRPPCPEAATPNAFAACTQGGNESVRVVCSGSALAVPKGEACGASGRVCVAGGRTAECGGKGTCSQSGTNAATRCEGSHLVECTPGATLDRGVDCAMFGGRACADAGGAVTCVPESDRTCSGGRLVLCDGKVAQRCSAGRLERVDCAALLPGGDCDAREGPAAAGADFACVVRATTDASAPMDAAPADSDAGAPGEDGCESGSVACVGNELRSCARGATFRVDCARVFGPKARCVSEATVDEDYLRGRCVPGE